jgi:hypothetical protein
MLKNKILLELMRSGKERKRSRKKTKKAFNYKSMRSLGE